jgi:hypothetical protein
LAKQLQTRQRAKTCHNKHNHASINNSQTATSAQRYLMATLRAGASLKKLFCSGDSAERVTRQLVAEDGLRIFICTIYTYCTILRTAKVFKTWHPTLVNLLR